MDSPDQELFNEDIASAEFCIGAEKGLWGLIDYSLRPDNLIWPEQILWIAAPERPDSPDRFYIKLNLEGYRTVAPTGVFWDSVSKSPLALNLWPKGRPNSRFAKVFRTDWKNAIAFYHPYDRVASQSHKQWVTEQPHLIWTSDKTMVDYLEEFYSLLQSGDYIGVQP